jgi:hypothetical protein
MSIKIIIAEINKLIFLFIQGKKVYEMDTTEKLEQAEIRKAKGTDFFKVSFAITLIKYVTVFFSSL